MGHHIPLNNTVPQIPRATTYLSELQYLSEPPHISVNYSILVSHHILYLSEPPQLQILVPLMNHYCTYLREPPQLHILISPMSPHISPISHEPSPDFNLETNLSVSKTQLSILPIQHCHVMFDEHCSPSIFFANLCWR